MNRMSVVWLVLMTATAMGQEHAANKQPVKAISPAEKVAAGREVLHTLASRWCKRKPTEKSIECKAVVQNDAPVVIGSVRLPDDKDVELSLRWRQTVDGIRLESISVGVSTDGITDEKKLRKLLADLRPWAQKLAGEYLNESDQKTLLETYDKQAEYSAKTTGYRAADVAQFEATVGHLSKSLFVSLKVK